MTSIQYVVVCGGDVEYEYDTPSLAIRQAKLCHGRAMRQVARSDGDTETYTLTPLKDTK